MKTLLSTFVAAVMVCVSSSACAEGPEPITTCEAMGNARPLCGWQNPEDITVVPGERFAIVSEYGGTSGERSGTLAALDLRDESRHVLYAGDDGGVLDDDEKWGDPTCPGQVGSAFSPHGIHLSQRRSGAWQLLAVQHGERESVEFFDVSHDDDSVALAWRGCVMAPEGTTLNDVVSSADDGFYATHMMARTIMPLQMAQYGAASLLGAASGHVLAWDQGRGFLDVPGTEGPMPNGIEISGDRDVLYVNYSARGELRRVDIASGEIEASIPLDPLDNVTWSPSGHLLVAAARAGAMEMMGCTDLESGQCPGAFAIVAVDPESMVAEDLYVGGPGTPSGAGTVGAQLSDGTLLIGTFAGDRIVRVDP